MVTLQIKWPVAGNVTKQCAARAAWDRLVVDHLLAVQDHRDVTIHQRLEALTSEVRLRVYVTGVCNLDGYAEISSLGIIP